MPSAERCLDRLGPSNGVSLTHSYTHSLTDLVTHSLAHYWAAGGHLGYGSHFDSPQSSGATSEPLTC